MRIKSIELAWFRGAADPVSLEPNCKSMVVYGDNGSGKSSFVDAVEYVLNNSGIVHLRNEYSGSRQENAIPNTHKPAARKTALRFKFKDDSELKIDFSPNGSSTRSGAEELVWAHGSIGRQCLGRMKLRRLFTAQRAKNTPRYCPCLGYIEWRLQLRISARLQKAWKMKLSLTRKKLLLNK